MQVNAHAMACDHRILVGGVVFHFLAGFGGGLTWGAAVTEWKKDEQQKM